MVMKVNTSLEKSLRLIDRLNKNLSTYFVEFSEDRMPESSKLLYGNYSRDNYAETFLHVNTVCYGQLHKEIKSSGIPTSLTVMHPKVRGDKPRQKLIDQLFVESWWSDAFTDRRTEGFVDIYSVNVDLPYTYLLSAMIALRFLYSCHFTNSENWLKTGARVEMIVACSGLYKVGDHMTRGDAVKKYGRKISSLRWQANTGEHLIANSKTPRENFLTGEMPEEMRKCLERELPTNVAGFINNGVFGLVGSKVVGGSTSDYQADSHIKAGLLVEVPCTNYWDDRFVSYLTLGDSQEHFNKIVNVEMEYI